MKSFVVVLVGSLVAASSCGRTEEPAPVGPVRNADRPPPSPSPPAAKRSADPPPPNPSPPAPSRSAESTKPRCVVPMQPPQPKAERAKSCPEDPEGNLNLPRGRVRFPSAPGSPEVVVELARTPKPRERGLMYRTQMGEDEGMLFSWNDEQPRAFWMHNTCIPLDMLFIDSEGVIVGILEQVPTLNDDSRAMPCPARHVLELNAGWARSHGVEPGQKVKLDL